MAIVNFYCIEEDEPKKDITLSIDELVLVSWDKDNYFNLRYRCPLCKVIEISPISELNADNLKGHGIKIDAIELPILEQNSSRPLIDLDELIDFHYGITQDEQLTARLEAESL